MRKLLKILGWTVALIVIIALAAYAWAYTVASRAYETRWTPHDASFPIPFPLTGEEASAVMQERLAAGVMEPPSEAALEAIALERAVARGKHIVESRTNCNGCHRPDFGGGVVIDSPMIGYWAAPNLTTGAGSVTTAFAAKDWDHAVRHALRHDLRTSSMPSSEFLNLSDHELSDIVAYIRSMPPVDRAIAPVRLGPLFSFIVATDRNRNLVAFTLDHNKTHPLEPPPPAPNVEFGRHLAQVCMACHGPTLSGGKLQGDPNMPIVANLTPHETGLKGWTEEDFVRALREGTRKDGTAISPMMPWKAYGQMTDVEQKALWAYLQTVPPKEKGNH